MDNGIHGILLVCCFEQTGFATLPYLCFVKTTGPLLVFILFAENDKIVHSWHVSWHLEITILMYLYLLNFKSCILVLIELPRKSAEVQL